MTAATGARATTDRTAGELLVLASRVRLEEKRIFEAFERRSVPYRHVDPRAYWGGPAGAPTGGLVLNREISYARAVYAARTLEAQGMTVVNSASATELCGDKWRTSLVLAAENIPTPRTLLALTPAAALDAMAEIGYPVVIKPLIGSWGRLVTRVPDADAAASLLEYVAALPGPLSQLVYVQRMVAKPGRDIRVAVIGGEPVGASFRRADEWRTNVARGAVTEYCPITADLGKPAVAAAAAVGAEVCGVDLIEAEDGELLVLEVNHGLEFCGLQQALGDRENIADRIVDHLIARAEP